MTTAAKTIECSFARRPALLAPVMAVLCLVLLKPSQADVAVWNRWEQTLTSSRAYTNPYQQVTLSVAYRGPDGQEIKGYVDFAGFEVSNGWLASCHKGSPEYGEPWKPYSAPRSPCASIDMPLGLYHRIPTKPCIDLEIVYDCKSLQERNPNYWAQPYPLRMTRSGGYEAASRAIPTHRPHAFVRPSGWEDAVLILTAR